MLKISSFVSSFICESCPTMLIYSDVVGLLPKKLKVKFTVTIAIQYNVFNVLLPTYIAYYRTISIVRKITTWSQYIIE